MSKNDLTDYQQARLEEIKRLISLGFVIIPLHGIDPSGQCTCSKTDCSSPGKHPIRKWQDRQNQAHTLEEAERLFSQVPYANIGVLTGSASGNIVVWDYDGQAGEEKMLEHIRLYGLKTLAVRTGNGCHIYYRLPSNVQIGNSVKKFDGIDLRGENGFCVAPPSKHISGRPYHWIDGYSPNDQTITLIPSQLLEAIHAVEKEPKQLKKGNASSHSVPTIKETPYGLAAKQKELDILRQAPEGARNDTLNRAAFNLAQIYPTGDLAKDQTMQELHKTAMEIGLGFDEAVMTIESGTKSGMQHPRKNSSTPAPPIEDEVDMVCIKDVEMQPINWLWKSRIARGKITIIAGNPGLGKSQLTAALAATVTKGGIWPESNEQASIGNVIFLSAEDDPADTMKPRLLAAGADPERCHVLQAIKTVTSKGNQSERSFSLDKDIQKLEEAIQRIGNVHLIVIDPVSAYFGSADSNNNAEVRGILAPLAAMAAKHGAAVVLLTHLNKSTQQDLMGRIIGSIGAIAAARSGYIVSKDEKKPEKRYFVPIKNNIGNDRDGFAFEILSVTLDNGFETSRISWLPGLVNAQQIINPDTSKNSTNGATEFLRDLLANGPMPAKEVIDAGDGNGYSKSTLQRAAHRIGVRRKKDGMDGGWLWSLPAITLNPEEEDL